MNMKIHLLIISFLAAHVTYAESVSVENDWDKNCYKTFYKHINIIAGSESLNCGFADFKTSDRERSKIEKCAKDAVARGVPYKFGYAAFGIDSAFCQVAIKDKDGKLWSVEYDSDVTGGGGENAEPAIWVSECKEILFRPGTIGKGSFFDHEGCQENKEIVNKVLLPTK
jgi:hypothetical protein